MTTDLQTHIWLCVPLPPSGTSHIQRPWCFYLASGSINYIGDPGYTVLYQELSNSSLYLIQLSSCKLDVSGFQRRSQEYEGWWRLQTFRMTLM